MFVIVIAGKVGETLSSWNICVYIIYKIYSETKRKQMKQQIYAILTNINDKHDDAEASKQDK